MTRIGTVPTIPRITTPRLAGLMGRPGEGFGRRGIWFSVLITVVSVGLFFMLLILVARL